MKIGLISDIHNDNQANNDILSKSIENIFKNEAVGLVFGGDIADSHPRREASFEIFKNKIPAEYHKNIMLVLGNHDVRTGVRPDGSLDPDLVNLYQGYLNDFGTNTTSNTMSVATSIDGYHFLCLNTDVGLKDSMELSQNSIDWLKTELAKRAEPEKPIFVITHQSLNDTHWRAGLFGGFGKQDAEIKEIFSEYPQIILLSGHIHNGFGVIEFVQRPFGTLVELPSLTKSENGVKSKGTGWLLNIKSDSLTFEAWDFFNNIHLEEHDKVLETPLFPVIANKLKNAKDKEGMRLANEAEHWLNLKYLNDMPDGNYTINAPSHYNINRNYDDEAWGKITKIKAEIIKYLSRTSFETTPNQLSFR